MPNLRYRDIGQGDVDAIHEIATHWPVVRQLGSWPWPPNRDFTTSRCKPYPGVGFVWAISLENDVIGTIAVTGAELGYMLHPKVAGRGVMTQAARDAMNHARKTFGVTDFKASVWHDNPASQRVLEKLGFVHFQTIYERSKARGLPVLCHHMRLHSKSATS